MGDRLARRALSQRGPHLGLSTPVAVLLGLECQLLIQKFGARVHDPDDELFSLETVRAMPVLKLACTGN